MSTPAWAPLTGYRVAATSAAIVVATSGIGFRGGVAAAERWRLATGLIAALAKARIISRGPKATGALRSANLREEWSPDSESSAEVAQYLIGSGIAGQRIAVQLHGAADVWDPFPEFLDDLRNAGAQVVPIRVYGWRPASRGGAFDHLVTEIAEEQFDAVSFTSVPAVGASLMRARELGGGVTAAAHVDEIRGTCVLVDGEVRALGRGHRRDATANYVGRQGHRGGHRRTRIPARHR